MKLTIIPSDGAVYKDSVAISDLILNDIPVNIHALQWETETGWIEFNDGTPNEHIKELPAWAASSILVYEEAVQNPSVKPPEEVKNLSYEEKLVLVRAERDRRIQASDWTQHDDVKALHDLAWVQAWFDYRQALRDLPDNITDIDNVVYPVPPM